MDDNHLDFEWAYYNDKDVYAVLNKEKQNTIGTLLFSEELEEYCFLPLESNELLCHRCCEEIKTKLLELNVRYKGGSRGEKRENTDTNQ